MKCQHSILPHITLLIFLLLAANSASAIPYQPGFVWNKISDYQNGTTKGSTAGNPNQDQNGNPAWSYEYYQGWGNWDNGTLLPWSGDRWANKYGNISKWDQNNPFLNDSSFSRTPLVRWNNPTGETVNVNLGGSLNLLWLGVDWTGTGWSDYLVSGVKDVEVVMGYYDASAGTTTSYLINQTFLYPEKTEVRCGKGYGGWANCVNTRVDLDFDLTVDAGDSIFWTSQAVSPYTNDWRINRWLTLNDTQLNITIQTPPAAKTTAISEPSTIALISLFLIYFLFRQGKLKIRSVQRAKAAAT